MAILAFLPIFSFVDVIQSMTTVTGSRHFFSVSRFSGTGMTGMAGNIKVFALDSKFCIPVMFKSGFIPFLLEVAILAFIAKSILVYVSNCVAGNADTRRLLIFFADMT